MMKSKMMQLITIVLTIMLCFGSSAWAAECDPQGEALSKRAITQNAKQADEIYESYVTPVGNMTMQDAMGECLDGINTPSYSAIFAGFQIPSLDDLFGAACNMMVDTINNVLGGFIGNLSGKLPFGMGGYSMSTGVSSGVHINGQLDLNNASNQWIHSLGNKINANY